MELFNFVGTLLRSLGIKLFSVISLSDCVIDRPYLLDRVGISDGGSAIIMAAPYYVRDKEPGNISLYAASKDYHLYFRELFDRVLPSLRNAFPENKFAGFSDHSPINELSAAAKAGLGVIGKNSLLITKEYGSYVFLGEIICDAPWDGGCREIGECEDCGLCLCACPCELDKEKCLSSLTQKKGLLSNDEIERMLKGGSAWGCDICQRACPHNALPEETPIKFFHTERYCHITSDIIMQMSDEKFSERAFSWRGRDTIIRNLKCFEGGK